MINKKIDQHKGFSLLEVLLASVIIVIAFATLVRCITTGLTAFYAVEAKIIALNLAQEDMAIILNTVYGNDTTGLIDEASATSGAGVLSEFADGWTVTQIDNTAVTSSTNIKKITVSVSWTFKGRTKGYNFITYITNPFPVH